MTIETYGVPALDPRVPILPGSRRFAIDLGGAEALLGLELGLDLVRVKIPNRVLDPATLVMLERAPNGILRAHSIVLGAARSDARAGYASRNVSTELVPGPLRPSFELGYFLKPTLPLELPLLDVPYYSQDGLGWCVPTSTSMVFRYFQGAPGGETVSNWWLAGKDHVTRGAVDGVNPESLMHDAGIDPPDYTGIYWDMDLVDSTSFRGYAESTILGNPFFDMTYVDVDGYLYTLPIVSGPVPPRPLLATSNVPGGLHAYVIVGADDAGVRVHDGGGGLSGDTDIAKPVTWTELRDRIKVPAGSGADAKEIWTAVLNLIPRPAENRRGSIVMLGGVHAGLTYRPADTTNDYRWLWSGDPYPYGAYWDAPNCWGGPLNPTWNCALPLGPGATHLSGTLTFDFYVANVTNAERTFEIQLALFDGGEQLERKSYFPTVPAHSFWTAASHYIGTFPVSSITKAGTYTMTFALFQDGQSQDIKTVTLPVL